MAGIDINDFNLSWSVVWLMQDYMRYTRWDRDRHTQHNLSVPDNLPSLHKNNPACCPSYVFCDHFEKRNKRKHRGLIVKVQTVKIICSAKTTEARVLKRTYLYTMDHVWFEFCIIIPCYNHLWWLVNWIQVSAAHDWRWIMSSQAFIGFSKASC